MTAEATRGRGGRPRTEIGRWGNIKVTPTGSGKHTARTQYRDQRGKPRRLTRVGDTPEEAERKLLEALYEVAAQIDGDDLTANSYFSRFVDAFLEDVQRDKPGTTYDRYVQAARTVVRPELGEVPLSKVTPRRLKTLFFDLRSRYSPSSLSIIRVVVAGAMNVAVEADLISHDRCSAIKIPAKPSPYSEIALSEDDAEKLLKAAAEDDKRRKHGIYDLLVVLLWTGCRVGEVGGLRWRDVHLSDDPAQCYIRIEKNVVRVAGKGLVLHNGKSKAAHRDIVMNEPMLEVMRRRALYDGNTPDSPVFPSSTGNFRDCSAVRWLLRPVYEVADIKVLKECRSPTHIYRKTVATWLEAGGATDTQIADRMGHASIAQTQAAYIKRHRRVETEGTSALDWARRQRELTS